MTTPGRFLLDGASRSYEPGDTVAVAVVRAGAHPGHGGTLCLAGDCGNCVAEVDGIAYVRTCLTPAHDDLVIQRHPATGPPRWRDDPRDVETRVTHDVTDVAVIGGGEAGRAASAHAEQDGRRVIVLDGGFGDEVVAVYAGPTLIVRRADGMFHLRAREVVVATGTAEIQPVGPGSRLSGLLTARAAQRLHGAGVDLGAAVAIGPPPEGVPCTPLRGSVVRLLGDEHVTGVVTAEEDGDEVTTPCDTVILDLGRSPRDVLARMADDLRVRVVGSAAESWPLPRPPTEGVVCPCVGTTIDDLEGVWARGFRELELVKRASLAGTGTCQGSVCLPHIRAWIAARSGEQPAPFTARPASRQITLGEAAADIHLDAFRRTALHDEHLALGARMDRFGGWWRPWHYGDYLAEYQAVREAVSLGDVSTLGKFIVAGPDAVEFLQRLYPTDVSTIRPGRSRYALLLNERGHVIDDGMICRETDDRYVMTFTTGGAGNAEMWMRDWLETWDLRVHLMDRTMSLAAINVTGPRAAELLSRAGLPDPPRFLQHVRLDFGGMPCHIMRLSFTGEASFEIHHPVDRSADLWRGLMALGEDLGIRPHGLQALFALRLEKGHVIIGMDTELDSTPRRLGMDWAVNMDKPDFLGKAALARTAGLPDHRRLVGLTMPGPAPTEGTPILADGEVIGHVTSAFTSPTLGRAVMLGWQKRAPFPEQVAIDGREAVVTAPPFYDPEGARARA